MTTGAVIHISVLNVNYHLQSSRRCSAVTVMRTKIN